VNDPLRRAERWTDREMCIRYREKNGLKEEETGGRPPCRRRTRAECNGPEGLNLEQQEALMKNGGGRNGVTRSTDPAECAFHADSQR